MIEKLGKKGGMVIGNKRIEKLVKLELNKEVEIVESEIDKMVGEEKMREIIGKDEIRKVERKKMDEERMRELDLRIMEINVIKEGEKDMNGEGKVMVMRFLRMKKNDEGRDMSD